MSMSDARWYVLWQYHLNQGQGQGHELLKVGNMAIFKSSLLPFTMAAGNWSLILKLGHRFKFDRAGFLIFVLVFVSFDFALGRSISCEESTISPVWGLIFYNFVS